MKKRNKLMKGLRAIALAALCFSVRGQPDSYAAEKENLNGIKKKMCNYSEQHETLAVSCVKV